MAGASRAGRGWAHRLAPGAGIPKPRRPERAGLMDEGYFLYYEEVDWAQRRGDLPLRLAPAAIARHHGGSAIGSGTHGRRASPLSLYWNHRSRMRYLARDNPSALPLAWLWALAKALRLLAGGGGG